MLKKQYYNDSESEMEKAFLEMKELGTEFLVAGRYHNQKYSQLSDLNLPPSFGEIFRPFEFRMDISSTQLRQQHKKGTRG